MNNCTHRQNSALRYFFILFTLLTFGFINSAKAAEPLADNREPIWLEPEEKAMILAEMRDFLAVSYKIIDATLADDMQTVYKLAKKMGVAQSQVVPEVTKKKLPSGFRAMGPAVHMTFEEMADEAATLGDQEVILRKLSQAQKTCVACHSVYRFE